MISLRKSVEYDDYDDDDDDDDNDGEDDDDDDDVPSSDTSARPSRGLTGQMWQPNNALCVSALRTDGIMHCLFCAAFTA